MGCIRPPQHAPTASWKLPQQRLCLAAPIPQHCAAFLPVPCGMWTDHKFHGHNNLQAQSSEEFRMEKQRDPRAASVLYSN